MFPFTVINGRRKAGDIMKKQIIFILRVDTDFEEYQQIDALQKLADIISAHTTTSLNRILSNDRTHIKRASFKCVTENIVTGAIIK
jgi:hypothetical protein